MNYKIILPLFISLLFFSSSCKKDVVPGIVGKWMSASVYTERDGWVSNLRFPEVVTYEPGEQFYSFTDVPGGSGTYRYNRESNLIELQYVADSYGNIARSALQKVETLTRDKLIVVNFISGMKMVSKIEYSRIN